MADADNEADGYHALVTLLESIEVGLVVLDLKYRVKLWNSFMENHSGINHSRLHNKVLFDEFPDLPRDWLMRKIQSAITLNIRTFTSWEQRPYLFRFRNTRPITGTEEFMLQNLSINPLTGSDGKVEQVCLVVYDVTDVASGRKALEHANGQLERLSATDSLTGLLNRATWESLLDAEFQRYRRYGHNTVLVMFDVDHFKKINDTHGHLCGDEVLREVARTTREELRQADRPGRYGGEEFGIILPETDVEGALIICERIRQVMAGNPAVTEAGSVEYTVSMGLAPLTDGPENHMQWLDQADKALYQAKQEGRNRCAVFRP